MLDALPKAAFSMLAGSELLKRLADRSGMARPAGAARRFVAGRTLDDALDAAPAVRSAPATTSLIQPRADRRDARPSRPRRRTDYLDIAAGSVRHRDGPPHRRASSRRSASRSTARRRSTTCGVSSTRVTGADMLVRIDGGRPRRATAVALEIAETVWNIGYRNLGVEVRRPRCGRRMTSSASTRSACRCGSCAGVGREPRDVALP